MTDFKNRQYVFFDLDGTVINSQPGIFAALRYATQKLQMRPLTNAEMRSFIGPSIGATFQKLYGISEKEANHAVDVYREYYGAKGLYECSVYEGIPALLKALRQQGKRTALTTKKPIAFARPILRHFGIDILFDVIAGSPPEEVGLYKCDVLENALEQFHNPPLTDTVLVGDSKYDCISANMVGMDCIAELYGFGEKQDLIDNKAARIVSDLRELTKVLCGEEFC